MRVGLARTGEWCHREYLIKGAIIIVLAAVGFLAVVFGAERLTSYVRRARLEKRRTKADYPLTDHNDPVGRSFMGW